MPGSLPIGGGIDGPMYADYQDVTDQQQLAGASNAVREKLNLLPDSLVLDINKFSGDLKLYFAKADTPVLPTTIKLRSSGPLETTSRKLEDVEKEFMRLIEMLPAKIRVLLLKNMMLPKNQRSPELNGLEIALQNQVKTKLWARSIVARFRRGAKDEEEEKERRGIFTFEEEEDLLPIGTVIPETKYVPIGRIDPWQMGPNEIVKQVQANTVFVLETQLGILKIYLASLDEDDPARALLKDFPQLITKMIRQSKTFINVRNLLDYEKAIKVSTGLQRIDLSLIQEQRGLLEKAQRYTEGGPSTGVIAFATAMLSIAVIGCQLLRTNCSLSALCTDGTALLVSVLMTSSPIAGNTLTQLIERLGNGFEAIGIPVNTIRLIQTVLLVVPPTVMMLSLEDSLPVLAAFKPDTAESIYEALETARGDTEDFQTTGEDDFKRMTLEATVRLAAVTNTMTKVSYKSAMTILKSTSVTERPTHQMEATCLQVVTMFSTLLGGNQLFERTGDASAALFNALTDSTLQEHAQKIQQIIDSGNLKPSVAEALSRLHLSELSYEGHQLTEQLTNREAALAAMGIKLKDLQQAGNELVELAGFFSLAQTILDHDRRQITPNVNVLA